MRTFFTRERFGKPQFLAGLLLLAFLGQCLWLADRGVGNESADTGEGFRIHEGLAQWRGQHAAGTADRTRQELDLAGATGSDVLPFGQNDGYDPDHSPLFYLIASAPLLVWPESLQTDSMRYWGWLARAPYLLFGVLLGASLWYVSRRLYGNAGGYIALALYCFSPGMIRNSAIWFAQPEMGAAWGAFGAIFTAIAVSHTLYAPREVVLWNWRRIVLLGLALALAIGSQFSLVILIPIVLGFLLYLAPTRRQAAIAIWAAGCGLGFVLLFASYFAKPAAFWESLTHAQFLGTSWQAFGMTGAYRQLLSQVGESCPAVVLAVPAALITYGAWPRARYFGNTAPLLIAVLFLVLALTSPHYPGLGFHFIAVPFLFLFVAGVLSDLLETRNRIFVLACVWGLLAAYGIWSLIELARVRRG